MRHILLGVTTLMILTCAGCGDAPAPEEQGTPPRPATTVEVPAQDADTPRAIGEAVGALYVDTMEQVVAALEGTPEVEVAKAKLAEIRARAVDNLVELGRKRAALDDAGKAVVTQMVRSGIRRVPADVFKAYSAAHKHYMAADPETGELLSSFNVITQYADFDLLEKQAPKEFESLDLGE